MTIHESLMLLFLVPFLGGLIVWVLGRLPATVQKGLTLLISLIPLVILVSNHSQWLSADVNHSWIPALNIHFHLAVDSLSLIFLYLTAIVIPISVLATPRSGFTSYHTFYGLVLILQGLLIGFFTARDLALFTIFWEAMLLPLYFIITAWGGARRQEAALKFLIYMIAGSTLMIAAVLAIYVTSSSNPTMRSFDMGLLAKSASASTWAPWLCGIFLLAFAVKTPLFPFHAWLPDAYYEAPPSGTILLAALLSKGGIYGILRIVVGFFPVILQAWSPYLLGLAIVGVFYGAFAAWAQNDYKRLIAYSSFSHVNFILAGLFIWQTPAHAGAILQAFNHGITITGLFLVALWLEQRLGHTAIGRESGMATYLPRLCWLTLFFVLSSVALPGLNNFVGELMILMGLFKYSVWLTALLAVSIVLSVVYMLRWMQLVYFETPSERQPSWSDIRFADLVVALPLVFLILWVGLYPGPILSSATTAAAEIVPTASPNAQRNSP